MEYNNGFAREEFLQHMLEQFPSVVNTSFSREMLENIVDFGKSNYTVSKNSLYYFLKAMIPEVEPNDLIPYIDKALLTNEVLCLVEGQETTQTLGAKYNKIIKCDLEGISTVDYYENAFLLTGDDVEPELEVDLIGALYFNTEFASYNRKEVAVVNSISELLDFCKEHAIKIPEECLANDGTLKVGGDRDYFLNKDLFALGWEEELGDISVDDRLSVATEKSAETILSEKDKPVYIHYGHKEFDKNEFQEIKNKLFRNKPVGGLWASPVNAPYGWKDWSKSTGAKDFLQITEDLSFKFTLSSAARVLVISSVADVEKLPTQVCNDDNLKDLVESTEATGVKSIDFEKLKNSGYDAVELKFSNDDGLYRTMFGWDCDSIVVLNPDVVEPVLEKDVVEHLLTDAIVRSDLTIMNKVNVDVELVKE